MKSSGSFSHGGSLKIRPGSFEDSYAVFLLFEESVADLVRRIGIIEPTSFADPDALARMWSERQPLYEHLALTADQFWVAEQDDQIVGFARSIVRDDLQELTELFVSPKAQSAGLGRRLMECAFPEGRANHRSIISSPDVRAQYLYMNAGLLPQSSIYYFKRNPEKVDIPTGLIFLPIGIDDANLEALAAVDLEILGHRRDVDHSWLLSDRQGFLYLRDDQVVGYGYVGKKNGPFALLDEQDYPAILAHAESQAAGNYEHFGLEVPTANHAAIRHLLGRKFKLEPFVIAILGDRPFGRFDRYIVTSPPFFL